MRSNTVNCYNPTKQPFQYHQHQLASSNHIWDSTTRSNEARIRLIGAGVSTDDTTAVPTKAWKYGVATVLLGAGTITSFVLGSQCEPDDSSGDNSGQTMAYAFGGLGAFFAASTAYFTYSWHRLNRGWC